VDFAGKGRCPIRVYFGLPGSKERERLLCLYLRDTKVDGVDIGWLVSETDGRSGRDIVNIINGAKINAMSENRDFLAEEDFKISLGSQRIAGKSSLYK